MDEREGSGLHGAAGALAVAGPVPMALMVPVSLLMDAVPGWAVLGAFCAGALALAGWAVRSL